MGFYDGTESLAAFYESPHADLRTSQKSVFFSAIRCRFHICDAVLYQIKTEARLALYIFFCRWPSNFIKKMLSAHQHCIVCRKGQRRDFLCSRWMRRKKGIFIISKLVFSVLMLIRCIASLLPKHKKARQKQKICLIERGNKLPSPVRFFLCCSPFFLEVKLKVPRRVDGRKFTGWDSLHRP